MCAYALSVRTGEVIETVLQETTLQKFYKSSYLGTYAVEDGQRRTQFIIVHRGSDAPIQRSRYLGTSLTAPGAVIFPVSPYLSMCSVLQAWNHSPGLTRHKKLAW